MVNAVACKGVVLDGLGVDGLQDVVLGGFSSLFSRRDVCGWRLQAFP